MKKTRNIKYYVAALVSLLTFLVYLTSLSHGFVGWDDTTYVSANPHIRSFNPAFFTWAFFDFYSYNWHPLTWMSHALDYAVWGSNPLGHHLTNNILHAVNTFVAVLLARNLLVVSMESTTQEAPPKMSEPALLTAAGVTGLLFGLHPLHVESVAWIAERKDLLCAFFFFLSIMMYLKYATPLIPTLDNEKRELGLKRLTGKWYLASLVFFILALLSKPMAVSLPLVLLILDWYPFKRIRSLKTFWMVVPEKVPFIVLTIFSSVVTVMAQESGGAIWEDVPLPTRVLVAVKSLVAYLGHMAAPINLLPFYPHPRNVSFFSLEYLAAVAFVICITSACVIASRKQKICLSVWGYYVVTLIPVLGIVQAGGQAMADRYTYLPSFGPFLMAGLSIAWIFGKTEAMANRRGRIVRITGAALAICVFVFMAYVTFQQIGIWKNGVDLWTYVIRKEPERVLFAYYNRAKAYASLGRYNDAIEDYSKVIALNYQEYSQVYVDRGLTYVKVGQVEAAAADLKKACDLGDDFGCKALQYFIKK